MINSLVKIFAEQIAELVKWAGAVAATLFLSATLSGCALTSSNINWTTYKEVDGAPAIEQYVETYWGGNQTAAVDVRVEYKNLKSGEEWLVIFESDEIASPEGQTEQAKLFWSAFSFAAGMLFNKGVI